MLIKTLKISLLEFNRKNFQNHLTQFKMAWPIPDHLKWVKFHIKHQESLCCLINNSLIHLVLTQNHLFPSKSSLLTCLVCNTDKICLTKTSRVQILQLRMPVKVSCLIKQSLRTSQRTFRIKCNCWLRMKFKFCTDLTTTASIRVDAGCSRQWFRMKIAMASHSLPRRRHSYNA